MIDRATVQKIKDTADIVDVVSDYVHLVRRGANYMGLCPFHNERTPSFSVNKARNYCHCFSCHKGGSPVNFIMEKEGISYHDALLQLAKKYGIKVEEKELTDEEKQQQSIREGMFIANDWAMNFFSSNLWVTEDGRDIGLAYLYGRGVTEEAIRQFHLGYCPDKGNLFTKSALAKGFNEDLLKQLGLTGTGNHGEGYDKFRGRVMFPFRNSSGKVIGFGGRDLKNSPAKYINSPESEIYKKSNELYGIYQARSAMVSEDKCYLVEGYLDVIGMWQSGIKNVVASSGTALTDGQISLIHRFTENITILYDGDSAGIKAALRGLDMFLAHNLNVKVLLLPEGEDPDSFARKHTTEEFKQYIQDHETDFIRFKLKILLDESGNDLQKKIKATDSIINTLAHIPDKVKRDIYIKECSQLLNVGEESIAGKTAKARRAITEQEKLRRRQSSLNSDLASGRISINNQPPIPVSEGNIDLKQPQNVVSGQNETEKAQEGTNSKKNLTFQKTGPLRPLEWKVIEYCLKYGFVTLWENENEDGSKTDTTVIEYINEELEIDGIKFSQEDFDKTFNVILDLLPLFKKELEQYKIHVLDEVQNLRGQGYEEIRQKDLSFAEIEREEKNLENRLADYSAELLKEFSKSFVAKELTSHEDDSIRSIANEAIREKHQLSNIFLKEGRTVEKEEDKLLNLILNSLNVWKNGILDLKLQELLEELKNLNGENNKDEETILHRKITEILNYRREMAKDIGDRTINPAKGRVW